MKKCHLHHRERSSRIWWTRICLIFLGWMLILAPNILHAQDTLWTRIYGGVGFGEYCEEVQQTSDGGFVFAGQNGFQGGIFPWLVKTNDTGDIVWSRVYYDAMTNTAFFSVQQTSDGGYIAGGISRANWSRSRIDYYLVRTDGSGNTLWSNTYSTPDYGFDYGKSVRQTSDGGFVLTGCLSTEDAGDDVCLIKLDSDQVGIEDEFDNWLSQGFCLSSNYPNPFNAMTIIRYGLPQPADIKIEIFDILGRRLETLIDEKQPAGYHQVIWNAGERSSGIYLYRIQHGNHTETGKMVLLK